MQGKKVVELVTPLLLLLLLLLLLRRFSTDFRKLLQRFALNICYLNSGWGSLGRGKPQRGLGIMQAWFPMGKPICGPGSCVPPRACLFSEPGLSYIHHCHGDQFPIIKGLPTSSVPLIFTFISVTSPWLLLKLVTCTVICFLVASPTLSLLFGDSYGPTVWIISFYNILKIPE